MSKTLEDLQEDLTTWFKVESLGKITFVDEGNITDNQSIKNRTRNFIEKYKLARSNKKALESGLNLKTKRATFAGELYDNIRSIFEDSKNITPENITKIKDLINFAYNTDAEILNTKFQKLDHPAIKATLLDAITLRYKAYCKEGDKKVKKYYGELISCLATYGAGLSIKSHFTGLSNKLYKAISEANGKSPNILKRMAAPINYLYTRIHKPKKDMGLTK